MKAPVLHLGLLTLTLSHRDLFKPKPQCRPQCRPQKFAAKAHRTDRLTMPSATASASVAGLIVFGTLASLLGKIGACMHLQFGVGLRRMFKSTLVLDAAPLLELGDCLQCMS